MLHEKRLLPIEAPCATSAAQWPLLSAEHMVLQRSLCAAVWGFAQHWSTFAMEVLLHVVQVSVHGKESQLVLCSVQCRV